MLDRVSLAIERAESLTEEAASLANGADRRRFVREKVLPQLEGTLEQMNPCLRMIHLGSDRGAAAAAAPPSGGSLHSSPHWARLHAMLRARSSHAVISTDRRRAEVLKEREHLEIACRSIPAPLALPPVDLRPLKPTKLFQAGVLSKAPESICLPIATAAKLVATGKQPVGRSTPSAEGGPPTLPSKPQPSSGASGARSPPPPPLPSPPAPPGISKPAVASSTIVQGVKPPPAATPGLFSFKFTPDTANVPQAQPAAPSLSLPSPPTAGPPPPSSPGALAVPEKGQGEALPITTFPGLVGKSREEQQPDKPDEEDRSKAGEEAQLPAAATASPIKAIEELDVKSLEVSSPTPKGPKSPPPSAETFAAKTPPLASETSTTTTAEIGSLGALSLGGSDNVRGGGAVPQIVPQAAVTDGKGPEEAVPGLFKVPQSVASIAANAPPAGGSAQQPFAISTSAFGFRPSTLEKAAASPFGGGTGSGGSSIFATPLSSPMPAPTSASTFGSLQSLGAAPQQAPAFGATSAFGALGGSCLQMAPSSLTSTGTAADRPVDTQPQRPIFGQSSAFGGLPAAPTQSATLGAGFSAFSSGPGFSAFATSAPPAGATSIFGAPSASSSAAAVPAPGGGDDSKKAEGKLSFTQFRS